uniref:Uncharacterized protein n=1 Tax=Pseudo-nitzschia australis TaxID=44445 RepID=A0A7S4EIU3_9STRA|mmetsp:Transcript_22199/g.48312  ORF Transcript_22199/g.48312 Transcript_22199/m.48312 type:complete len:472 (+) Transcript_22199:63-1478(+)
MTVATTTTTTTTMKQPPAGEKEKINGDAGCTCEEEEEFWPAPPLLTEHKIHTIRFGGNVSGSSNCNGSASGNANSEGNHRDNESSSVAPRARLLHYKSLPSEALTPLDMTYNTGTSSTTDCNQDEFYDGTGNLMWMAAVCFGHLVAQNVEKLRPYLQKQRPVRQPATATETATTKQDGQQQHRVCELGCGTGGAGISLLLFSNPEPTSSGDDNGGVDEANETKNDKEEDSLVVDTINGGGGGCHVVFTDNDVESLELCRSNCELNHLDPRDYSHQLLWWGSQEDMQQQQEEKESDESPPQLLEKHSFDTVLATDVVYDLKMIAPLLQTVEFLLKKPTTTVVADVDENENKNETEGGGHLILSHVPRFCIPRKQDDNDNNLVVNDDVDDDEPREVFLELERFIQSEASKVGLSLVETVRPHKVLREEDLTAENDCDCDDDDNDNDNDNNSMEQLTLEKMKEANAVVFVFRRL